MTRATPPREEARLVFWALVLYGGVQLVGMYFGQNATGAAAVQAVLSEFGAGRLGIAWSDPASDPPTSSEIARRAARGAAMALAAVVLLLGFAVVTGAATLGEGHGSIPQVVVGLLIAGLASVRDELLLRGLVIRAFASRLSAPLLLLVSGLAAAAARFGAGDCTAILALSAGAAGVAAGALWLRDRGAWMAWGARVAWLWTTQTLTHDGLFDVRARPGAWGGGDASIEGGYAGAMVLVGIAAFALVWGARAADSHRRASLG